MEGKEIALLIPIFAVVGSFLLIFGIKFLDYQERMAMIARGLVPVSNKKEFDQAKVLRMATVMIGAGLGLLVAKTIDDTFYTYNDDRATPYYFAFIGIGAGLGLLFAYFYTKNKEKKEI